ncbi:MAG: peptide-methionine (R)-S-oxide reductase [Bacteroidetes bacterium]|nr:MAG: peptide-methionine (R)-S-oxide reductase [Bacteroidota bacterium]
MNWNDVIRYARHGSPEPPRRVEKTEAEWREQLTPEQFRITRTKGTEAPGSGAYCESHARGRYACICCGTELFDSSLKYDSRSGWPSFTEPVQDNVIKYERDTSHGMIRIEVMCSVCDGHLGHVFPDGPEPTGLRFCINSASIQLLEAEQVGE